MKLAIAIVLLAGMAVAQDSHTAVAIFAIAGTSSWNPDRPYRLELPPGAVLFMVETDVDGGCNVVYKTSYRDGRENETKIDLPCAASNYLGRRLAQDNTEHATLMTAEDWSRHCMKFSCWGYKEVK